MCEPDDDFISKQSKHVAGSLSKFIKTGFSFSRVFSVRINGTNREKYFVKLSICGKTQILH